MRKLSGGGKIAISGGHTMKRPPDTWELPSRAGRPRGRVLPVRRLLQKGFVVQRVHPCGWAHFFGHHSAVNRACHNPRPALAKRGVPTRTTIR